MQPPEINSGRIYSGFGSGSLVAASAAWDALAAELGSSGAAFSAVVSALTAGPWLGPSSMSAALAAAPFVLWMEGCAARSAATAVAAAQAATAFEGARAGVVPPPEIAENRARLASLIATNFLGMNTPAIAATEAQYGEMWAQDSSVLYNYAAEAAALTGSLMPVIPPAPTVDPAGMAGQAAAVGESAGQSAGQAGSQVSGAMGQMGGMASGMGGMAPMLSSGTEMAGMIPQALHGLSSPLSSMMGGGGLASEVGQLQSLFAPFMNAGVFGGALNGLSGLGNSLGSLGSVGSIGQLGSMGNLGGGGGLVASMGNATTLRGTGPNMSVPQTWAQNVKSEAPRVRLISAEEAAAPETNIAAAPRAGAVPATAMGSGAGSGGGGGAVSVASKTSYREGDQPPVLKARRFTENLIFG